MEKIKYWIDTRFLEAAQQKKWFWRGTFKFLGRALLKIDTYGVQRAIGNDYVSHDKLYLSRERAEEVYERLLDNWRDDGELVLWTHADWTYGIRLKEAGV